MSFVFLWKTHDGKWENVQGALLTYRVIRRFFKIHSYFAILQDFQR